VKVTIYLPDGLAAGVKAELGDANVSAICQAALRGELDRVKARAEVGAEGFERVEVYDSRKGRDVAFQGRQIGDSHEYDVAAWLTPKDAIAVRDGAKQELYVYDDYESFTAGGFPEDLVADVAGALGERYVETLDI
jgi:hypothetical protein